MCSSPLAQAQWLQNPLRTGDFAGLYPEFTCAAGSACIANATTGGYNCQRIFAVTQNKPCQYAGVDGTCLYNLTCQPNATLGTELYCQPYPAAPAKGQAQCDFASQATAPQCPFGQACQCSAVGANATCQPFVGGNLCVRTHTSLHTRTRTRAHTRHAHARTRGQLLSTCL